jgi:hypothetical protein
MLLLLCCLILGVQGCTEGREYIEVGEDANDGFGGSGLERDDGG